MVAPSRPVPSVAAWRASSLSVNRTIVVAPPNRPAIVPMSSPPTASMEIVLVINTLEGVLFSPVLVNRIDRCDDHETGIPMVLVRGPNY